MNEHLIMRGSKCVCLACNTEFEIGGQKLLMAGDAAKLFLKHHKKCAGNTVTKGEEK